MNNIKEFKPLDKKEEKNIEDLLRKSRIDMLFKFPFFGILALNLDLQSTYSIPSAGTDGNKFYYNPYFIKSLKRSEINWLVVHEILHCVLKHLWRKGSRDHEKFNYACDYAIHCIMMQFVEENKNNNSNIENIFSMIEGGLYNAEYNNKSAEEIYELLPKNYNKGKNNNGTMDEHGMWEDAETQKNSQKKAKEWEEKMISAAKSVSGQKAGNIPGFLKRLLGKILKPQKNWKILLQEFIEPEPEDYSFSRPDRRFQDYDFFLPSICETTDVVKKIVYLVDTSGSIDDKALTVSYSEILGAINQFQGKLSGHLGFFDTQVYDLTPFESVEDVLKIKPKGGGGTCFHCIFEYINEKFKDISEIAGIIILTDGYAEFPKESITNGIPTLWLINNEDIKPPWGTYTTIEVDGV